VKDPYELIPEGHKNREISSLLWISIKTTEKQRVNLMEKLELHDAASLTALTVEEGIINK
jgi:DNA-binding NarL/FixJ family response regulator